LLTDDEQQVLRQKAVELLRAERALVSLRTRHEQTVSWLRILQSLPQLIDHKLPALELYKRIGKSLIMGLRVQRAGFFGYRDGELRLLAGKGTTEPVSLGQEARALVERATAGRCNEPTDAALVELARATGLHRFLFTRIRLEASEELLLVAGFDRERAEFQYPFDDDHPTQLASLGQHIEVLLRNAKLVSELERDKERLQKFNETLEHRVEERTAELARKNRDMRLVLDNVDQGFITLSPEGCMATERSRIVDAWFGACAESLPLWEYLAPLSESFGSHFRLAWDQLVEGLFPLEVCLTQLPTRLTTRQKTFAFGYSPFFRGAQLEGVLVIVSDITGELAREREEAEQHELLQSFKRLMLDRSGFRDFVRDTSAMMDAAVSALARGDRRTLLRTIHTLKGNSATVGLSRIAAVCHGIEEGVRAEDQHRTNELLLELEQRWRTIAEHVGQLIGSASERILEVPEARYKTLLGLFADRARVDEAFEELLAWRLEPLARSFERLGEQAVVLARRAGSEVDVQVETGGLRVDPEHWSPMFRELTHVVRNAVVHGFQSGEERMAQGKSPRNRLSLAARVHDRALTLEIGDDGRGVDWQALRATAREQGLPFETHDDLVRALFHDGISTRRDADEMAGRGIGMAAVKSRVDAMSGQIHVRSSPGTGTTWTITVPVVDPEHIRRDERAF
jgi:HPt (histidine-containing phosphotransfer) domain-containing protein/two-component sensor histidine kinase